MEGMDEAAAREQRKWTSRPHSVTLNFASAHLQPTGVSSQRQSQHLLVVERYTEVHGVCLEACVQQGSSGVSRLSPAAPTPALQVGRSWRLKRRVVDNVLACAVTPAVGHP